LVELHVRVEVPPEATAVGVAPKVTVGRGYTVTVAVGAVAVPPGPVHAKENVAVEVSPPVTCVPLLASVPLQSPEAVHDVEWAELHVSVDALPAATAVGFAVSWTVGGTLTVIATVAVWLVP
jgi:hypothetical protein